jgi:aspartate carbamoyltransferase catalytic subunit
MGQQLTREDAQTKSTLKHLLGIEGMSRDVLMSILDNGSKFLELNTRAIKKAPPLRGKTIFNLFLEPSTRTRASFEIAGKRLSADTINLSGGGTSTKKGETLLDTARTLQAMNPDVIVVRHQASGAAAFLANHLKQSAIVNAGDGMNEHPSQALLDLLSISQRREEAGSPGIEGLKVAIVGDVRHSRVARSHLWAHGILGNRVNLVGPSTLIPPEFASPEAFGSHISISHDLHEGLEGADVVMVLRMQLERQGENFVPSLDEYTKNFCVSETVLHRVAPECMILHPGPVNRGVEIATDVHDGPRSLVTKQVENGVAVRMAILFMLVTGGFAGEVTA